MATFAEDFEACAGEPILMAQISGHTPFHWSDEQKSGIPEGVCDWASARGLLDYNHDRGYGSEDCHEVTAWSKNWVLFVACYDGSTWVTKVPRNPTDHTPRWIGGG